MFTPASVRIRGAAERISFARGCAGANSIPSETAAQTAKQRSMNIRLKRAFFIGPPRAKTGNR